MTDILCPWPYAAKPYIQFEFDVDRLRIYLTFRHPMDQSVTPATNLFTVRVDGVDKTPSTVAWKDFYRLTLVVLNIPAHPARVHCTYAGPSPNLRINWQKQYEPWWRILCNDVPLDWEHVLDVDVDNARVNVNGVLAQTTKTITTGIFPFILVDDCNILLLDCSGGDITINGLSGGVLGQVISLAKLCAAVQDVTLVHNSGIPPQKFYLHAGGNETLTGEYGGWTFVCNGSHWYDISHARHV